MGRGWRICWPPLACSPPTSASSAGTARWPRTTPSFRTETRLASIIRWAAASATGVTMAYGYWNRILRVNLTNRTSRVDEPDDAFYRRYVGGRSFIGYYL